MQSDATWGLGVPYTLCGEENDVPMNERHAGRETTCLQEYERSARQKSTAEHPDVQTVYSEYPSWLSSVVFQSENPPGN